MRSVTREERPQFDTWAPRLLGVALALLMFAPVLGAGYVLVYDMVFVPHAALNAHALGTGGGVPRAAPGDAVVALISLFLPGWLIQKVVLVSVPVISCVGAWRLSPARTLWGAATAAVLFTWNPYVAERWGQGHWSLLIGYAMLPWVFLSARHLRRPVVPKNSIWAPVAVAGIGVLAAPMAAVLCGVPALLLVLRARLSWLRRAVAVVGLAVINLPWVIPGFLSRELVGPGAAGVQAFAARADTPLGDIASVVTFGGIWNALVVPPARHSVVAASLLLVVVLMALVAWGRVPEWSGAPVLALLGVGGLAIAAVSTTTWGRALLTEVVDTVPGAGMLRDAQKWLAWWVLLIVVLLGPAVEEVSRRARVSTFIPSACVVIIAVLAVPSLAWGQGAHWRSVSWPSGFTAAAQRLNAEKSQGSVLVLPWGAFRAWPWNADRAVLDPWPRLVDRRVIVRDDLPLTDITVPGEDPIAAEVDQLLRTNSASAESLERLGIRYVVVDRRTRADSAVPDPHVTGELIHRDADVEVVDLGSGAQVAPEPSSAPWLLPLDLVALVMLVFFGVIGAVSHRQVLRYAADVGGGAHFI